MFAGVSIMDGISTTSAMAALVPTMKQVSATVSPFGSVYSQELKSSNAFLAARTQRIFWLPEQMRIKFSHLFSGYRFWVALK